MGAVGAMRVWMGLWQVPATTEPPRAPQRPARGGSALAAFFAMAATIIGSTAIEEPLEPLERVDLGPPIPRHGRPGVRVALLPSARPRRKWCDRCRGTGDIGNGRACPKCSGGPR